MVKQRRMFRGFCFLPGSCRTTETVVVDMDAKPVSRSQLRSRSSFLTSSSKRSSSFCSIDRCSSCEEGSAVDYESKTWLELRRTPNALRIFTYGELKQATKSFRPDSALGQGGFGTVYKGWIELAGDGGGHHHSSAGMTVAVKVLNQQGLQGHREWLAEVNFLGQLRHPHLVKLIGYACENEHRLLVYEFMPRGSLENHLFRKAAAASPLSWSTRMRIALGAARGLAFLHGTQRSVIYRDFKTSNILLDSEYTAKLSDFGLAKDGPEGDETHVSTRIMGTYGYAAPEYVMTGHLTSRSDVYSFGVVLLELLTGRRSMDKSRLPGEHNLVEWARPYLRDKRKLLRIMDPRLEGMYSVKAAQKAACIAYYCLSHTPKTRPLMCDVVKTLEALQNMRDMANNNASSYTYVVPLDEPQKAMLQRSLSAQAAASNIYHHPHP